MPVPTFTKLGPSPEFGDLVKKINTLVAELQNLMLGVDSINVFEVGGWRVTLDQLASSDGDVGMSTTDTAGDDIRFWAGDAKTGSPKFTVTKSGILTAVDGVFEGEVTADSGTIGGWVISADSLKDSAGTVGMSSAVTGGDDIRFFAGHTTPSSAPFRVTEAGAMAASSGAIGGFTITTTALTAVSGGTIQNKSAADDNVRLDDTGFHANDASGVVRIEVATTPGRGAKALMMYGSAGPGGDQSVITYDTETVDGASRTGKYIIGPNAQVLLLSDDGDFRLMNDNGSGIRSIGTNRPEMQDGFGGWGDIAFKSEVDLKADIGSSTSSNGAQSLNGGIPIGTVLMVDGGGTVTWNGISFSAHTHTLT